MKCILIDIMTNICVNKKNIYPKNNFLRLMENIKFSTENLPLIGSTATKLFHLLQLKESLAEKPHLELRFCVPFQSKY